MYTIREIAICKQTKRINPVFEFDSRFDLNQLLDASVCSGALLMVVVLFFCFLNLVKMMKRERAAGLSSCAALRPGACVSECSPCSQGHSSI